MRRTSDSGGVAIGPLDHDVEVISVLAAIGGGLAIDFDSPADALDVGDGGRIGAVGGIRCHAGVAFEVEVEGYAGIELIAVA